MKAQGEMFGAGYAALRVIRRNFDPQPSHDAAAALHRSGALTRQCLTTLTALVAYGDGCTSFELASGPHGVSLVVDLRLRYLYARRLSDLANMGHVEKRPARTCRVTGRSATTWAVTDAGRAVLREGRAA